MKEKDLIKLYFENYYPNNKKYVYKEDFGIGSIIFLFLLLLMITTFSKSNSNQISKKINNDPEIPKEIIKNLEIIKNILIKDNPNKNLDDIMNLLDNLNDNLNLLSTTSNKTSLVESITDQIIKFLKLITEIYSTQTPDKKDKLFTELNKILNVFGLSDLFLKLLKASNEKGEITADNTGEVVQLSSDQLEDFASSIEEDDQEEDEEDEEEDEDLSLSSYIPQEDERDEEEQDILKNKNIDEIKREIISKKLFIDTSKKSYIKTHFNYIITNFNKYDDELVKDLYLFLYNSSDDIETFEDMFTGTPIFNLTLEFIEEEEIQKSTLSEYDKFLLFLKQQDIYIEEINLENRKEFLVKIDINKYKQGKLIPLKNNNHNVKCYYIVFYEKGTFTIYIDPKDISEYKLYDSFFQFIINENISVSNFEILFTGKWRYNDFEKKISINIIKNETSKYDEINTDEINNKTYILKEYIQSNKLKEVKNPNNIDPKSEEIYWYCIKYDDNTYYLKKIEGDFLSYLKDLSNKKMFSYQGSSNFNSNINFNDKENLVDLIYIDSHVSGKGLYNFLKKISINKNVLINNKEHFKKLNPASLIRNSKTKILEINTSRTNWLIGN